MCLQLMESFCDELREMIINLTFLDVASRSLYSHPHTLPMNHSDFKTKA